MFEAAVAAEPREAGDAGAVAGWPPPRGGLAGAVAVLEDAVDQLAAAPVDGEADALLLDTVAGLQRLVNRVSAQQVRVLDAVERRQCFRAEGAVSAASWLRERVRLDHYQAVRRVEAARRLGQLERLREVFAAGAVTLEHVTAVTSAAVPQRMEAVAACEEALVQLALRGLPRDVRRAVERVRELADPDGTDAPPLDDRGLDKRRGLEVFRGIGGLVMGQFTLDQVQGEMLFTVIDAYERPDPAGTPSAQRRSAGQRRADALADACRALLDSGQAPRVQGNRPHLVLSADLESLFGVGDDGGLGDDGGVGGDGGVGQNGEARGDDGEARGDDGVPGDDCEDAVVPKDACEDPSGCADDGGGQDGGGCEDEGGCEDGEGGRPEWERDGREVLATLAAGAGHEGRAGGTRSAGPAPGGPDRGAGTWVGGHGHGGRRDGRRPPRLRHTGELDAVRARRIAREAKVQVVLTMGPWRVVNVGRWHRRLPAWLRMALELVHRHCRGPCCDRPISWTEAHHVVAWHAERGETDLNSMVPVCLEHHQMVTVGGWRVSFDPDSGACAWTGPDGQVVHTYPPTP